MMKTIINQALFLCLTLLFNININLAAPVTWVGGSGDWGNSNNWDTGQVPDANDEVLIPKGEVFLPTGYTADATHVEISSGAKLQLRYRSTLNVDGAVNKSGLLNDGKLLIYGFLNVSNVTGATGFWYQGNGIANSNQLFVGPKGIIDIQNVAHSAIYNYSVFSRMTNRGEIIIEDADENGIYSSGNNINYGAINIDLTSSFNATGIKCSKLFKNNAGAAITVTGGFHGLNTLLSTGVFKNWGDIICYGNRQSGIINTGIFTNFDDGYILLQFNGVYGVHNSGGTFNNSGACHIQYSSSYGFSNSGIVNNYQNILIFNSVAIGMQQFSGAEFSNHGFLELTGTPVTDIWLYGSLINHDDGHISVQNNINIKDSASLINYGKIAALESAIHSMEPSATFVNHGLIIDTYDQLAPIVDNQQVIIGKLTGTLQNGVPYTPALNIVATDKVTINEWETSNIAGLIAGTYDVLSNSFTPNNNAIGLDKLHIFTTINSSGFGSYSTVLLDAAVLPFQGKNPGGEMLFRNSTPENSDHTFNVFPNPTTGAVNINSNQLPNRLTTIQILNALGQSVFKRNYDGQEAILIDFPSHLLNGIYFIQIYQDSELLEVKRIQLSRR